MGEEFDLSSKSEQQLRELIGSQKPGTDFRVACEIELEKRRRRREFWRRDIVAWIALAIALISLLIRLK